MCQTVPFNGELKHNYSISVLIATFPWLNVHHFGVSSFCSQESGERYDIVRRTYTLMHTQQTVESVRARVSANEAFNPRDSNGSY